MQILLKLLSLLLLFAYPWLIYFGLTNWGMAVLAPCLLFLFLCRILVNRLSGRPAMIRSETHILIIALCLVLFAWVFKAEEWILVYPIIVSLVFFITFALTLVRPPSMIERFARAMGDDLDDRGVRYTRRVTEAWCLFFLINALIAAGTVLRGDLYVWAIYNGLLSYLLIGSLILGEVLLRRRLRGFVG